MKNCEEKLKKIKELAHAAAYIYDEDCVSGFELLRIIEGKDEEPDHWDLYYNYD